jgi:antitoxin component YwqK of YwqJK toxin-antitoxin module
MRRLYPGLLVTILMTASCVHNAYDSDDNDVVDEQYVHEYGVAVPKYHWEESGQNGQVIKTLRQGIICSQSYYCGLLEGETTYTFPHCELIEKVEVYSQDQLRKETFYYMAGRPKKEIVYNPSEPTITTEWYENGQVKSLEKSSGDLFVYAEYYDPEGHQISMINDGYGRKIMRDNYGILVMADSFKDGRVEYRTTYYPNGAPKEITPYRNGIVEGLRKTYYQGGEPNTIETWIGGRQEGVTTLFADGQKAQEVPYIDGRKNGRGKIFQDGTIVIQEPTWKDDLFHGPCITTIDGRRITEWYYKGKPVTKGYYDSFTQFTPIN